MSESVLRIMGDIVFVLNYDFEIEQVCGYDEELIELVKSLNYHKTRLDHFILFKDSLDNLRQLIFDSFTNESEDFVCNKLNLYLVNQTQEFSVCVVNDYDNRGLLQIIVVCKQLEVSSLSPGYPPFHAAIDVSVDGMALIDENWNLVYCNKSLETFLNSNKNDIISKALSSFFK
ncbi:MAG: hypothetical protein JJT78_10475, partial [Leptospira sp.]|nr:hypothetical protein [Leptospira sp.]